MQLRTPYDNPFLVGDAETKRDVSSSPKSAPASPSLSVRELKAGANARDWTADFQHILSMSTGTLEQELARSDAIKALVTEFVAVASAIGAQIVDEIGMPLKLRKFPPTNIGGAVGGEKVRSRLHESSA